MIGEPKTLLRKRQVKQLLSTTERILEVRAITSGSDISLASFSDSCVDLTEVAGRHGIEVADQVSCAAGWNPLSSSGRHRFWALSLHSDTQIDHLQVPCHCSAMVFHSQSLCFVSTTTFQVGSRSVAVVFEWNALATHAKTVLSFGHLHDSWFMDIGDSAGPVR